jgi:ligand-binding sensor domain-containing protein
MPGGIVRSANNGETWHRCWVEQTDAPVVAIAPSPDFARDRTLLAATDGDGILRSTDGGRHWELSNFGLREFTMLDVVNAPRMGRYEHAFALSENGLYLSPNGGRAWRRVEIGGNLPVALAVSPRFAEDGVVCLGTEAGELHVSRDAGQSWKKESIQFEAINALAFDGVDSLLVGTMSGVTALALAGEKQPIEMTSSVDLPSPVFTLATIEDTFYAGLVEGLYKRRDEQTWQAIRDLSARRFVWYLAQLPDHWLAGGPEEGVWRTADGGATWQSIWEITPLLALAALENQIWISTLEGIVTSRDQGESWQMAWEPDELIISLAAVRGSLWAGSQSGRVWQLAGGEWQPATVPFAGMQFVGFVASDEQLLAAVWAAETRTLQLWRPDPENGEWAMWFSQAAGATLPHVAWRDGKPLVGLGNALYRLAETGWQRQRLLDAEGAVTAICALESGWLAAVTGHLLHSEDGAVWTEVGGDLSGQPVVALVRTGENLLAGTADGRVWVSPPT